MALLAALSSRLCLVALFFPFSALDKVINHKQAVKQASEAFHSTLAAQALIAVGFCVEVFMSLGVLTGIADRLCAFVLAGYCMVTALLWKQFWAKPDFRLRGQSAGRETFWDFLKNFAVAGGFLVLAFRPNGAGVYALLQHPFGSTHPYAQSGDPRP